MTLMTSSLAQPIACWLAATGLVAALSTAVAAQAPTKQLIMHDAPQPIAAIRFDDGQGQSRSLADFRGKIVLLNVWATWCVPCRKEMPALDRLQTALESADFLVVPLSIDRGGIDVVRRFFVDVGIKALAIYLDSSGKAMRELGVLGLPTTILVDREGREIGRLIGPAEWDAPDMVEFISCLVSKTGVPKAGTKPGTEPAPTPVCGRGSLRPPPSVPGANRQP
jgi:thiol-disulfide isomerase/thioredoxin